MNVHRTNMMKKKKARSVSDPFNDCQPLQPISVPVEDGFGCRESSRIIVKKTGRFAN
ncbi:hypothetical protein NKI00_28620 [Mesorhizobium sp. M0847]